MVFGIVLLFLTWFEYGLGMYLINETMFKLITVVFKVFKSIFRIQKYLYIKIDEK